MLTIDQIQNATLARVREIDAEFNIYTDGSAQGVTTNGGAGVVITTGDLAKPTIRDKLLVKGAPFRCSFEEESRAMQMVLVWIKNHLNHNNSVAIYTDSRSLCKALLGNNANLDEM